MLSLEEEPESKYETNSGSSFNSLNDNGSILDVIVRRLLKHTLHAATKTDSNKVFENLLFRKNALSPSKEHDSMNDKNSVSKYSFSSLVNL